MHTVYMQSRVGKGNREMFINCRCLGHNWDRNECVGMCVLKWGMSVWERKLGAVKPKHWCQYCHCLKHTSFSAFQKFTLSITTASTTFSNQGLHCQSECKLLYSVL